MAHAWRWIRSLVFVGQMYLAMPVLALVFTPLALWDRKYAFSAVHTYCHWVIWTARWMVGLRGEVRGEVPRDEVLICSKHQSFFDIILLVSALPRPKFIMKRELRWAPILGLYALRMGSTPVARGQKSRAMKAMVSSVDKESHIPSQLVIYPQGTRVAPGVKMPYRIGAGVLYQRRGVPCVPAATNAGVFWGRKSFYRRPGLAVVEYLPEIPPGLPIEQFMARLQNTVETASAALEREAGFVPSDPA